MPDIALISCVSMKRKNEAEAGNLYISPLFKYSKEFATERFDIFYILSAKHGLLSPDKKIHPYDMTLNNMSKENRKRWADKVYKDITERTKPSDKIIFLAGENYREFLIEKLRERGNPVRAPFYRMSIGEQLQWYSNFQKNFDRIEDLDYFYSLLNKLNDGLNNGIRLGKTDGKMNWPKKGVYFFFGDGEFRKTSPFESRVVRVGTHAISKGSSSTLWNRLRTHRGTLKLGGNHRGSVFRLHVGNSLISKYGLEYPTWSNGSSADRDTKEYEKPLEKRVSEVLGKMKILWLAINDKSSADSDRAFIERNSIALLSTFFRTHDTAGKDWLGNYNPHNSIIKSSLWNVNHVEEDYDPRFLEIFEKYVNITINNEKQTSKSLVPHDWLVNRITKDRQLNLFDK